MAPLRTLIARCRSLGVKLSVVGEDLRVAAPPGVLTSALRGEIAESKAELISFLRGAHGARPTLRAPRDVNVALAASQRSIWFMDQLLGVASHNLHHQFEWSGAFDRAAFVAAVSALVERHEALRVAVIETDGEPVFRPIPPAALPIAFCDLSAFAGAELVTRVASVAEEQRRSAFDLACAPLFRIAVVDCGSQRHVVLFTIHHIVFDGWSLGVFVRDLAELYAAQVECRANRCAPLSLQVIDHAFSEHERVRTAALEPHRRYWRSQLAGLPVLDLSGDGSRTAGSRTRSPSATHRFSLEMRAVKALKDMAAAHGCTPYMALLAVFLVLVGRITRRSDVCALTPFAGRNQREWHEVIGCLMTPVILRCRIDESGSFLNVLEAVRRTTLQAFDFQDLPLAEAAREAGLLGGQALDSLVNFVFENAPLRPQPVPGAVVKLVDDLDGLLANGFGGANLSLVLLEHDGSAQGLISYRSRAIHASEVKTLADRYQALVSEISQRGVSVPVQDLWPYSPEEKRQARWRTYLAGATPLELLPDRVRPKHLSSKREEHFFALAPELVHSIRELALQNDASLFATLLAGVTVLLSRHTGQRDICLGALQGGNGSNPLSVLVRAQLSEHFTFADVLGCVEALVVEAQDYAHASSEHGHAESTGSSYASDVTSLPVAFLFEGVEPGGADVSVPQSDLLIRLRQTSEGVVGSVVYSPELFDEGTAQALSEHLQVLLRGAVCSTSSPVLDLPLLTAAELHQQLVQWNDTVAEYPADTCLHELFEEQVPNTPDAIAVACGDEQVSYRELNARANRLAATLRAIGVKGDVRVGVCLKRSVDMLVALLGTLKAGGAYVPFDPSHPPERLAYALEDSGPLVVLVDDTGRTALGGTSVRLMSVCQEEAGVKLLPGCGQTPAVNVTSERHACRPLQLAYVIYTSGSTGRPKAVCVPHCAVVNFIASMTRKPGLRQDDVMLALTTLSFDIAVLELFLPLSMGARIVLADRDTAKDAQELLALIEQQGVTTMQATPSTWRLLLSTRFRDRGRDGLRSLCGGEAVSAEMADELQRRSSSAWNMYGPTECTVWSSCGLLGTVSGRISLGRPIANTCFYVLDEGLRPVPAGVAGELYIGGLGVARGYHGRGGLTAERFVCSPFGQRAERLYRTGDIVRWLPSGEVEYLGRNDNQVKVRGHRVELGEVEACLCSVADVSEAVVVAREDLTGDVRLMAYYTGGESARATVLRMHAIEHLPDYMVPAAYVRMASLPLTPNGKLDRKALPAPGTDAYVSRGYEPPEGQTEVAVANMWVEVLMVERVGRHDNFFELGGHSLLAARLMSRVRQAFEVEISLRVLFDSPTVEAFAGAVETARGSQVGERSRPIERVARDGPLPLSYAQQRLWFLEQMAPGSAAYNIPVAFCIEGALDLSAIERALRAVVRRHESLRTTFRALEGEPHQAIESAENWKGLRVVDLAAESLGAAEAQAAQLLKTEVERPFDLACGPLFRALVARVSEHKHVVALVMHHIVSDGWSMEVLFREMVELYSRFAEGREPSLPQLAIRYADYAQWQREWLEGGELNKQLSYWRDQLSGAEPLELPTDRPRPAMVSPEGAQVEIRLGVELTRSLKELGQRHGATLFITMLAAFNVLLSRYTGQRDLCVGTPVDNRRRTELEGLVGFFVNTLVLRTKLKHSTTFAELLEQTKQVTLEAWENQDLPFEKLVAELRPQRDASRTPLFQALLAVQQSSWPAASAPAGLRLAPQLVTAGVAKFDLTLSLAETEGELVGSMEYRTSLFDESTIQRMAKHLEVLLQGLFVSPHAPVVELPLLTAAELKQQVVDWNDTTAEYSGDKCFHELFEEQVQRTPDAVAVVCGDELVSYRGLNEQANQLARHLRAAGVKPGVLVGIGVDRGVHMVVALLASLKAGGAYVPLDPGYPAERLAYMLNDAAPIAILVHASSRAAVARALAATKVIDLDEDHSAWTYADRGNLPVAALGLLTRDLAYVIYTSGSTGEPKGAMNEHRGLCNLVSAQAKLFSVNTSSRILQFASFSFDASVSEIGMALVSGATLCLAPREMLVPGRPLLETLARNQITHVTLPASAVLAFEDGLLPGATEALIVAGEALPLALANDWWSRVKLFNAYGPTEASVCATVHQCVDVLETVVPIGRPTLGTRVDVLSPSQELVPVGVRGELYIGGVQVGRGYLGQPGRTAERFLPSARGQGARQYRSGDLGRWRMDGTIEFLGRSDFQVKVRGYRIEPGEVEACLRKTPGVSDVVVVARADGFDGQQLVAYYTGAQTATAAVLRAHALERLPEYMVPAAYVRMASLPLTPNGKLDRNTLPPPGGDAYVSNDYEAPFGQVEERLAQIWSELLRIERIGRHDNFFELGGHSLLATRLMSRVRQSTGADVPLRVLFEHPTLGGFASAVSRAKAALGGAPTPPIGGVGRSASLVLSRSPSRRRMGILRASGLAEQRRGRPLNTS